MSEYFTAPLRIRGGKLTKRRIQSLFFFFVNVYVSADLSTFLLKTFSGSLSPVEGGHISARVQGPHCVVQAKCLSPAHNPPSPPPPPLYLSSWPRPARHFPLKNPYAFLPGCIQLPLEALKTHEADFFFYKTSVHSKKEIQYPVSEIRKFRSNEVI